MPGSEEKANILADGLKSSLADLVRVTRPIRMATFRLSGLDPATDGGNICAAVASRGGCRKDDITVGDIRRLPGGRRVAWVKCPVDVAEKLTPEGRFPIGWSSVVADSCRIRRLQCYKCWDFGHTRESCGASVDRSRSCFRCGQDGHVIKDCANTACCVLCKSDGLGPVHRLGSASCRASTKSFVRT